MTINGDGELIVNANYDKGIHSKDDLKIISGKIEVNSVGDAIKGKDCLLIKDGEITITTGVDGLKSNNDSNEEKGYVIIEGGKINISAGDDAVYAESWLIVYGGEINITECYEGLEGKKVEIYGGGINIVSSDDSINAASGSSGDTDFTIPDRDFNFSNFNSEDGQTPPEMSDSDNTDGTRPEMPSGDFTTGDGQTPPDKPDSDSTGDDSTSSGFGKGGFGGFGGFGGGNGGFNEPAEDGVYIKIFGGNITLSGGNDVLDSNGTLEIRLHNRRKRNCNGKWRYIHRILPRSNFGFTGVHRTLYHFVSYRKRRKCYGERRKRADRHRDTRRGKVQHSLHRLGYAHKRRDVYCNNRKHNH